MQVFKSSSAFQHMHMLQRLEISLSPAVSIDSADGLLYGQII